MGQQLIAASQAAQILNCPIAEVGKVANKHGLRHVMVGGEEFYPWALWPIISGVEPATVTPEPKRSTRKRTSRKRVQATTREPASDSSGRSVTAAVTEPTDDELLAAYPPQGDPDIEAAMMADKHNLEWLRAMCVTVGASGQSNRKRILAARIIRARNLETARVRHEAFKARNLKAASVRHTPVADALRPAFRAGVEPIS